MKIKTMRRCFLFLVAALVCGCAEKGITQRQRIADNRSIYTAWITNSCAGLATLSADKVVEQVFTQELIGTNMFPRIDYAVRSTPTAELLVVLEYTLDIDANCLPTRVKQERASLVLLSSRQAQDMGDRVMARYWGLTVPREQIEALLKRISSGDPLTELVAEAKTKGVYIRGQDDSYDTWKSLKWQSMTESSPEATR